MQQQPAKRQKKRIKTCVKYPGIGRHAEKLGLNRASLYRYLEGIWEFPESTRERYEQVIADEAAEAADTPALISTNNTRTERENKQPRVSRDKQLEN